MVASFCWIFDMNTLVMNEQLLDVLCALKAKQHLALCEISLPGYPTDWRSVLRDYLFAMPDDLIKSVGLKKNEYCFEAVVHLSIPELWMSTESSALKQFSFSY